MSSEVGINLSQASVDEAARSRFTYRDLRLLSQYSTTSPLRVIALVDFDCFYAQCERVRLGLPEDQPLGVQQFKHVIATNYPARAAGLKKVITAVEARKLCPNIILQHVPTWREGDTTWAYRDDAEQHMREDKSSLDYYRLQSRRAIEVVKRKLPPEPLQRVEKASIDEIFVDLSAHVHSILLKRYPDLLASVPEQLDQYLPRPWSELLDWQDDEVPQANSNEDDTKAPDWDDVALSVGAEIIRDLRKEIHQRLKYTCSAGIASNKVVAKLAAGHNKPNKQTVVLNNCVSTFLSSYKFTKLRGLGGKLGREAVKAFKTEMISDLLKISSAQLRSILGSESGTWVYHVIRGFERSEVTTRTQLQSMLSAKTFEPGIESLEQADRWLQIFAADIVGRLEEQGGRRPKTLAIHHHIQGRFGPTRSKQTQIPSTSRIEIVTLTKLAKDLLKDVTREEPAWPCWTLSMSVSDFFDVEKGTHSITSLIMQQKATKSEDLIDNPAQNACADVTSKDVSKKRTIFDFQGFTSTTPSINPVRSSAVSPSHQSKRTKPGSLTYYPEKMINSSLAAVSTENGYRCPQCTSIIPAEAVLEHLDWHVALDLQGQQ